MAKSMSVIFKIAFLCLFFSLGSFNSACIPTERDALLEFKHGLQDPSNRLESWVGDGDCCQWYGVICHNLTGHVMELHLRSLSYDEYEAYGYYEGYGYYEEYLMKAAFSGEISSSLLNLKELRYLDLSNNYFRGLQIPKFLGSLGSLRVLNLSAAGFAGLIPHELGNLSNLHYLNLNGIPYYVPLKDYDMYVDSLHWLSGLSMLEFLDMSNVNLSQCLDWFQMMNKLPSLVELYLSDSRLVHIPQFVDVNISSLSVLDLSGNLFRKSLIPSWVFHLKTLKFLNLAGNHFEGPIHTYLQNMSSLQKLDLSGNYFSMIPKWIFSLRTLFSLNLRANSFKGPIPNELQNISSIKELDLSDNRFNSSIPKWLYNFRDLELLDLHFNSLQGKISSAVGNMTSLITLDLSYNDFDGGIPKSFKNLCNLRTLSLSYVNLSEDVNDILEIQSGCVSNELQSLDLHDCNIFGQLTNRLRNFNKLTNLDLSNNSISGPIPSGLAKLFSLISLQLSYNSISGPIPLGLAELTSLAFLWLNSNKLGGTVPEELGGLANLQEIYISDNLLEGNIFENHFANLTKLRVFEGSMNRLTLRVSSDWTPPFTNLGSLGLRGWNVGSQFPSWLHSLKYLYDLDLSNSSISSSVPNWFWNSSSHLYYLNLSHNQICGVIPYISNIDSFGLVIDLSSNHFEGSLPRIPTKKLSLDFSNNSFSGSISHFICDNMHEEKQMVVVNLANNFLWGEIPDCWSNWTTLLSIRLSNNNFSGNIPKSIGQLRTLRSLHTRNNSLSGEIPSSLQNCKYLTVLDLGENELTGKIPTWMGKMLSNMSILSLRGNKLDGHIPKELCHLRSLHILDLAHNSLSGNIPNCISHLSFMATTDPQGHYTYYTFSRFQKSESTFEDDAMIMVKGRIVEYKTILKYVRSMDLSDNKLSGEIPREITRLVALQSLNLSDNFLFGKIPGDIGVMRELEVLDVSQNQLQGRIPKSITNLTFLSMLNVSNNNLSGIIPTGTQLQSFNSSSFIGNEGLCGPPLNDNCNVYDLAPTGENGKENGNDDGDEVDWIMYVSISLGFIVGFWCILCPLFLNRRWRLAYYSFLDRLRYRVWWSFRCH